ncbi:archease [Candidatus Nanohalovita haloferacivicina]|uniref:archease n=1 Tax=Candidatus Nanohalovita haloferacivicina TaxID=2978046 RepID=UPI00325FD895|nr:Archease [Candidatus Nanohalobia archaeon BNXNv]
MSYEILEHTADEKFQASGDSLEEAFSEAVKAFSEIVGGFNGQTYYSIEVESESQEALLFDFMDKLIFLQDVDNVVISYAEDLEIEDLEDGYRLTAKIWADNIENSMSVMDVKGPTYSEMEVTFEEGKWRLQVVLDI